MFLTYYLKHEHNESITKLKIKEKMKLNQKGIAHLIVIGLFVGTFVTGTGVAVASNSSKPGDALYSIDRGSENIQLALALTSGQKNRARKAIAEERLKEIRALLAEEDLDIIGIANALSNFEEHRSRIDGQSDDDDDLDEQEQEVKNELDDKKSKIDKLSENQQKNLENQREQLKKQYEQALKDGDTTRAASLKAQIDGFEDLLKKNEQDRESQKNQADEQKESTEKQAEAERKAAEEQAEAEKKAAEALREAEKKAAEQQ